MVVQTVLLAAVLGCVASTVASWDGTDYVNYLMTAPQDPQLQIGTNFTATCLIKNSTEVTADDLYWKLAQHEIPAEQYTKINDSALNVTITITDKTPDWLYCYCRKKSPHVQFNSGKYIHGIFLKKGYFPEKPENLSCIAIQEGRYISPTIHCEWKPERQLSDTSYTLNIFHCLEKFNKMTRENYADVKLDIFPSFVKLDIWVEAENMLGKVESEHLIKEANLIAKTNPPSEVNIISEDNLSMSLLLNWTRPIDKRVLLNLIYEIRFSSEGSHTWSYVPEADMNKDMQSFRLQNLRAFTVYVVQVRCKNEEEGYWSDWSSNSTQRTPSSKPGSKPDVWFVIGSSESAGEQHIQLLCKEPELSNGIITEYLVSVQNVSSRKVSWEHVAVTDSDANSKPITLLKRIQLNNKSRLRVRVTAINVKGKSPMATIMIPQLTNASSQVQRLDVFPDAETLIVEWSPPLNTVASEYVIQWTSEDEMNWQREKKDVHNTTIKGDVEKFVRYNVSVFALFSGWIGKAAHKEAYFEQAAPLKGPSVKLSGKPDCTEAHLIWDKIPLKAQRGFITNYTLYYTDGITTEAIVMPSDTQSYTLKSLARNTRYDVWIKVSNMKGSALGSNHSFTTLKYGPGEIEGIVVGVSLGFLFVVVLTMLICICKRNAIKKSFWPQIPNPGASTIGTWAPDCHVKAETSSDTGLSGISIMDVDVCDRKSVFEEDKACLPLKKDKYMSEEHSSGIGGSSCMSSPRQSVSDSDEGGDIADTTASTVQYSSVVASSGYKGQTPNLPTQQAVFSRSESTQPLLESEENPDVSLEGSRQSQHFPPSRLCEADSDSTNQLEMEDKTLDFCPVEHTEDRACSDEQSHEFLAAAVTAATNPISSYMPQLGGYRPQ